MGLRFAFPARAAECRPRASPILVPIEDYLATLAGKHRGERCLELFGQEMVRDDRRQVESALHHVNHLVPGLKHLAAVDSLDLQTLENHLVPVDRHLRRRYAEHGNLAAMVHVFEHVGEGLRHPGHFHTDIEAFGHAQFGHDIAQAFGFDVDRACRTHASSEREPVVVNVSYDNVTCADVARDRARHDANRTCAGDEHILADQVERQGCVRGIAERVKNRRQIVGNVVGDLERVECRNHEVLSERAFAIDANADCVATQMAPPRTAIATVTAGDVAFARYTVTDFEPTHLLPDFDDLADVFVPDLHRHWNSLLRPFVPIPDMDVSAADRCLANADHDVVVTHFGFF